jgi:hypothetical protein
MRAQSQKNFFGKIAWPSGSEAGLNRGSGSNPTCVNIFISVRKNAKNTGTGR